MDGMNGNMAVFDDWAACNHSPRTYEFFNKDFISRSILDFGEDDSQSSSSTMDFEKKKPPISFEEGGKKMGLDCSSDDSSELIGFNVQKSCLNGVHDEKMAEMARFNMLKALVSQSDQENNMFEDNSSQNESKNLISSLPEECSSYMLLSPGVSPASMEYLDNFSVSLALPSNNASLQENFKILEPFGRNENTHDIVANQKTSHLLDVNESPPPPSPDDHQNAATGVNVEFSSFPECDPTKDGYNWRKYGQKQLKGCGFPCSYYKCTHPKCPAKKKIERSLQGHITEIIYKGSHNHPKPPPNPRSNIPSSKQLHGPQSDSTQDEFKGPKWSDGSKGTSSASFTEFNDPSNLLKSSQLELKSMGSSCATSIDKEDSKATHGSLSVDYNTDQEEMESKRRSTTSRAIRDRRIVVQIPSDLDIPYDGYRWRKYGQKVVKGNSNPRSYYKCTNRGCSVRKHVERSSDDLNSVICSYEGKHNHDVPSARNINLERYFPSKFTATAAMQLPSLHTRPELAQDSFTSLESCSPICTYGLLGRGEQLGTTTGFSFGFDQSNLVSLCPSGSDLMRRFSMPFFPPIHQSLDRQVSSGNIMPLREPKNEPL